MASRGETIELHSTGAGFKDGTVQTSEVDREISPRAGELSSFLRVRKLFSSAQIFAFSLTYMSVWESMNS
jgi:hypothetical protein